MAPEDRISYRRLNVGDPPPQDCKIKGPFKAVLVLEQDASPEWRSRICKWLVAQGCLYAMAWGVDCVEWHDEIDWASIEAAGGQDVPEDRFIMTTWHDDEPLEEVFWFAAKCAMHSSVELQDTLILHVSKTDRSDELIQMLRNAN